VDIRQSGMGIPPVPHAQDARATFNPLVVTDALASRAEFSGYDLIRVQSEEYAAN